MFSERRKSLGPLQQVSPRLISEHGMRLSSLLAMGVNAKDEVTIISLMV